MKSPEKLRESQLTLTALPREIPHFKLEQIQACFDGLDSRLTTLDQKVENPTAGWRADGLPEHSYDWKPEQPKTYTNPDTEIEFECQQCLDSFDYPNYGSIFILKQSRKDLDSYSGLETEVFRQYDRHKVSSGAKHQIVIPDLQAEGVILRRFDEDLDFQTAGTCSRLRIFGDRIENKAALEEKDWLGRILKRTEAICDENGSWKSWLQTCYDLETGRKISSIEEKYSYDHPDGKLSRKLEISNYDSDENLTSEIVGWYEGDDLTDWVKTDCQYIFGARRYTYPSIETTLRPHNTDNGRLHVLVTKFNPVAYSNHRGNLSETVELVEIYDGNKRLSSWIKGQPTSIFGGLKDCGGVRGMEAKIIEAAAESDILTEVRSVEHILASSYNE